MQIVLVRHGQTVENATGVWIADAELTQLGCEQADLLSKRLAGERFDRIFSSPLVRALDTAHAISKYHENKIEVVFGLRELREAETHICMTGSELRARYPDAVFPEERNPDEGWVFTGRETREIIKKRAISTFSHIKSRTGDNDKILIVSHVGFITAFFCAILSQDSSVFRIGQENTAINRVELKNDEIKILSINDSAHLNKQ